LRKQCGNSKNNAKTPLTYNYFLRFSIKIFPDFWPQATPQIGVIEKNTIFANRNIKDNDYGKTY